MLDYNELEEIIDEINRRVILANRTGDLEALLHQWGLSDLIESPSAYETDKEGKIVVIGESEVKEKILLGIIKELGIDKDRFEFCLEYGKGKTYQYSKLRYNPKYRVVLFGPIPHSSKGKHDSSSVIAEMKANEGYPRVEVLSGNNAVKITKSNFKKMLSKLLIEEYI